MECSVFTQKPGATSTVPPGVTAGPGGQRPSCSRVTGWTGGQREGAHRSAPAVSGGKPLQAEVGWRRWPCTCVQREAGRARRTAGEKRVAACLSGS